jgi:hypothetical protein
MTRFTEHKLTKQWYMEGHSCYVRTMKNSEFTKHNISSNNPYVQAQKVRGQIYCLCGKFMEFITYNNVSGLHILLKKHCITMDEL